MMAGVPSTCTVSLTAPTANPTSTRILTPALTCTPLCENPLKPLSDAVTVYMPTGVFGNV